MLLLRPGKLEERRNVVRPGGPLAPLFESLADELEPVIAAPIVIPAGKALLSRTGGRCERDGTALEFDPWSPHHHRCPRCGAVHQGEYHHRWWIMSYQLWLAERAVHGAVLHALRGDARHAALARDIVRACADRYLTYPNQDNVLGPTRLFFSTYLESIWLLQIVIATEALNASGDHGTAALAHERVIEPAARLIAGFDEGMSNRQVWNNAAMLAASATLGREAEFDRAVYGESGLLAHLGHALLADGTWYEGDNYHQFALRGLWYAITLVETRRGDDVVPRPLRERFERAFVTPYLTALPDFTLPSRKDSQYAVSLRQWRMAELAELGFARTGHPLLGSALARTYEEQPARQDTGRSRSAADVERNGPGGGLSRADLGWRALLHAVPALPALVAASPRSALLEGQGYAVFRRDEDIYVGAEFGQSGGGHGHPDRLNFTLYQGATRWLDDMGTGSYVDPSLHWFRSTLAHNAPLVEGRSQALRDGRLVAYDEREGLGWLVAEFPLPDLDVTLRRTLVVAPDYLIDELEWSASREVRVELPWHLGEIEGVDFVPASLDGGSGIEDGFSFVTDVRRAAGGAPFALRARRDGRVLSATLSSDRDATLFTAVGPGQPPPTKRRFALLRAQATEGRFRAVLAWTERVKATWQEQSVSIEAGPDERHEHRRDAAGWHVEFLAGAARSSIDLAGFRATARVEPESTPVPRQPTVIRRVSVPAGWLSDLSPTDRAALFVSELAEPHYRRSEDSWTEAGAPRATVACGADGGRLVVFVSVRAGDPHFSAAGETNPYDNEPADTMKAGIQLYVRIAGRSGAWMLVPEAGSDSVRVRGIEGWDASAPLVPQGRWRSHDGGYEMRIDLSMTGQERAQHTTVELDVIVNETTARRERRRGQLVMSGARGEFVYLRGDRHDAARLIPFLVVP